MKRAPAIIVCSLFAVTLTAGAARLKTVVTGQRMEIIDDGSRIIFSGQARVRRGVSMLSADTIVQDKKINRMDAAGSVVFHSVSPRAELMDGMAAAGWYLPEKEEGQLTGDRAAVVYRVAAGSAPVRLEAERIYFDQRRERLEAEGRVAVITDSGTASGSWMLFTQSDRTIDLRGNGAEQAHLQVVQPGQRGSYAADRIMVYLDGRRAILTGSVAGRFTAPRSPKEAT